MSELKIRWQASQKNAGRFEDADYWYAVARICCSGFYVFQLFRDESNDFACDDDRLVCFTVLCTSINLSKLNHPLETSEVGQVVYHVLKPGEKAYSEGITRACLEDVFTQAEALITDFFHVAVSHFFVVPQEDLQALMKEECDLSTAEKLLLESCKMAADTCFADYKTQTALRNHPLA